MQNGIGRDSIRRDTPQTSGSLVSALDDSEDSRLTATTPTSNYHFARMRCAEQTARSLSARHSAHIVLGGLTGIAWDQVTEVAAARDSYYLLAAAHRAAGVKRQRAERRTANRRLFRQDPARYTRLTVRAWASEVRHTVRSIRRAVNV